MAISNPVDTFNQLWVNGDARSRASFFSYTVVSVVGLKGIDKLGNAASKVDNTIPYNAFRTDKLKEFVKTNVYANMQQKAKQTADLLKSNFGKEAINKTIQAVKNSEIITKARNTLNPTNMKAASTKLYADVVKAPIAKTQDWMQKKKERILNAPLLNVGPIPLGPTTNMTVRDGIDAAKDSFNKIVGGKNGEGTDNKSTGNDKKISKAEINTAESIKKIINGRGYSVDEFAELLHPDRVLNDSEKFLVDSIKKEIGLPSTETIMSKTIPQSDLYKYLFNQYDGVRGFTAIGEHGANLNTLIDKYNGARLDYNNTAFKTTTGVDGISQSVGLPDKFYGTIEYKANDVSKISIPDWAPNSRY